MSISSVGYETALRYRLCCTGHPECRTHSLCEVSGRVSAKSMSRRTSTGFSQTPSRRTSARIPQRLIPAGIWPLRARHWVRKRPGCSPSSRDTNPLEPSRRHTRQTPPPPPPTPPAATPAKRCGLLGEPLPRSPPRPTSPLHRPACACHPLRTHYQRMSQHVPATPPPRSSPPPPPPLSAEFTTKTRHPSQKPNASQLCSNCPPKRDDSML